MFASIQLYFSLFFLLFSFTNASRPFGNLGPEGTVIFFNGFHFLSGNASAEISADHYCVLLSDDFLQCVIYTTATATTPTHLAGIEYIISPALFETLDIEQLHLWHSHSHSYEVSSGSLIEPGMPASIDLAIMKVLKKYGKEKLHSAFLH
jgi:hypothetical protein